jgi:hypothetical protein
MTLPEHEDDDRGDELEEEELPPSIDVQPEDPRHGGDAGPEPIDRD